MLILGIDPGLSGGIFGTETEYGNFCRRVMPTVGSQLDIAALSAWLSLWRGDGTHAYLESANAHPKQGVSSVFKFGRVYGITEALLVAHRIPYTLVSPAKWTREMHAGIERRLTPKERSLIAVQRLLPGVDLRASERCKRMHSGLVDAALIALYGVRQQGRNV